MKRAPAARASRAWAGVSTVPAPGIAPGRADSSAIARGVSGTVNVISTSAIPPRSTASAAPIASAVVRARITASR